MVSTAFPSPALLPRRHSWEVGLGAGSSPQPHVPSPRPGPAALPSPTSTGTCKAGDGGRKRVPNYLL